MLGAVASTDKDMGVDVVPLHTAVIEYVPVTNVLPDTDMVPEPIIFTAAPRFAPFRCNCTCPDTPTHVTLNDILPCRSAYTSEVFCVLNVIDFTAGPVYGVGEELANMFVAPSQNEALYNDPVTNFPVVSEYAIYAYPFVISVCVILHLNISVLPILNTEKFVVKAI